MDTIKNIRITDLTQRFVNIVVEEAIQRNGQEIIIDSCASSYQNSSFGRARLQNDMPEWVLNSVFAAWGDTPTPSEETNNSNNEIS